MVYLYDSVSLILQEKVSAELVKQEREFYHNQSLLLQSNSEENAKFRHDIRNHLLALEGMVQDGKTDKAITYIKSLTDTKNQVRVYSQTENIAIDSIINYKLSKAEEDGIKVLSNIAIPRDVQIPEDDMVVILGNLLDNAVEAASRVKENAYIKLSLEYDRGCMYMSVKNSFDNIVDIKEGKMQTRKVDKAAHGIGLKSVQLALDKYHGQLDIEYEKNEFDVTGMLYLN
jgi:sensor histidine kinase regulating citrate/malate metabolism